MAFRIYSAIPGRVVSVQTDDQGTFEVVGQGVAHERQVNLRFAEVHVAGGGINQAQRVVGIENGARLEVRLLNDTVRIQPVP
jgi:hypothetical protein